MKIKQTKKSLGLNPNKPWLDTVVAINYDNSEGRGYRAAPAQRFYINLPQVVADALGVAEVRGDNQADVMEHFDEAIEQFKKLETEVTRVILYDFEAEPLPDGHPGTKAWGRAGWMNLSVRVWAGTYEETVSIAGDGVRRYSYEPVESGLKYPGRVSHILDRQKSKRLETQVPWSEKNEAFFQWVLTQMTGLVNALSDLYESDKVIEAINAGRLLPLGATEASAELRKE